MPGVCSAPVGVWVLLGPTHSTPSPVPSGPWAWPPFSLGRHGNTSLSPSLQGAFPPQIPPLLTTTRSLINTDRTWLGCCPVSSALGANPPSSPHHHPLISSVLQAGPRASPSARAELRNTAAYTAQPPVPRCVQREYNGFVRSQQPYQSSKRPRTRPCWDRLQHRACKTYICITSFSLLTRGRYS